MKNGLEKAYSRNRFEGEADWELSSSPLSAQILTLTSIGGRFFVSHDSHEFHGIIRETSIIDFLSAIYQMFAEIVLLPLQIPKALS